VRVLFATPEILDFVQVGGLAAVAAALPRALRTFVDIRVIVPGYRSVLSKIRDFETIGQCAAHAALPGCSIGLGRTSDGLAVYVINCPALYDRPGNPYGDETGRDWGDNDIRFARFSSAAALVARGAIDQQWAADLVHANDWQSALIPAYLAWGGKTLPSIFTIHNLAYQGLFSKASLREIGAPDSAFHIEGVEFYDKLSFLKAGIVYGTHLTTVSQNYAQEITTPEFGCGLEGLLKKRANASELSGILNGIDQSWDPRLCKDLHAPFGAGDWDERARNAEMTRQEGSRAVHCSRLSPGLCIKRALILCCLPRIRLCRREANSWLLERARRDLKKRCSMRIANGPMPLRSRLALTMAKHAASLQAVISH
jgi:starch synthase